MEKTIYILIVVLVALNLVVLVGYLNKKRESNRRTSCLSRLHSIGLCLKQYSMDHNGWFPDKDGAEGLDLLRTGDYLSDCTILVCPSSGTEVPRGYRGPYVERYVDYVYRGGLSGSDSVDSALLWDKPNNHVDFGNALFLSGKVRGYSGDSWRKMLERLSEGKSVSGTPFATSKVKLSDTKSLQEPEGNDDANTGK